MLRMLCAIAMAVSCARTATVEGRVVNAVTGVGVAKASVRLRVDHRVQYTAVADTEGHFRFTGVEAGIYHFACMAAEYTSAPRNQEDGPAIRVTATDQTVHLDIQLDPM